LLWCFFFFWGGGGFLLVGLFFFWFGGFCFGGVVGFFFWGGGGFFLPNPPPPTNPIMYNHQEIEKKWQKRWEEQDLNEADDKSKKPKKYILDMFPYPSGEGLHVGHVESYTATDIVSRYLRLKGYNVLHPQGLDAFGLPAENYAIKTGIHPAKTTKEAIANFKRQMEILGLSYDWSREINTSDPKFYKWTQWIFLQLYKKGLAYKKKAPVNWCKSCKTVLANEQVINGKCERCEGQVIQKDLEQWFFKVTEYAEELLNEIDKMDWSEALKHAQKNWIGRSEGALIDFKVPFFPVVNLGFKTQVNKRDRIKTQVNQTDRITWFISFPTKKGERFFIEPEECLEVINSLYNSCLKHNFNAHEIVIMTDHIHLIIDTDKRITVDKILKYLKGYSAKKFIEKFDFSYENSKGHHLWTPKGNYQIIDNKKQYEEILEYVQKNPKKENLNESERLFTKNLDKLYLTVEVFTTRPDTLFGATYLVLAPEHETINYLRPTIENWNEVEEYIKKSNTKNKLERTDLAKEKTGVELKGVKAINPGSKEEIPIWIADYVMMDYGTGAIMAVPAHDVRDFEFAKKYKLPIIPVIQPIDTYKSYFMEGSYNNGLEAELKQFNFEFSYNKKEGFFVEINNKQLEQYTNLVKKFLKKDFWCEIIGSKYIFIYGGGEYVEVNDKESETRALDLCKKYYDKMNVHYGLYDMLWNCEYYHDLVCYIGEGRLINSGKFTGLTSEDARDKITKFVGGKKQVQYKIRDWLVSRQRYWGAPIPMIYCDKCGLVPVPEKDLPVILPDDVDFRPTGESPLARSKEFHQVKCPKCGSRARRESDTMDSFVCSSWYFLRYADPHNDKEFADSKKLKYWLPVDLYIGGMEHAVGHLIYARFMTKVLRDLGYLKFNEPFLKIRNQGIILASDSRKMSKRWGNVINPDDVVKQYGADTLRMYEMFMGPLEDMKPWDSRGIVGVKRFLEKVYKFISLQVTSYKDNSRPKIEDQMIEKLLNKTIKKVTEDIENLRFNTAISALMIYINHVSGSQASNNQIEKFLIILSPFAPHLSEELWQKLDHSESIFKGQWPDYDPKLIINKLNKIVVQVNGKLRDMIEVERGIDEEELGLRIRDLPKVKKYIEGKEIKKFIYIKDKLVNIVV